MTDRDTQRLMAGRAVFARVLADECTSEVRRARDLLEPTLEPGEKVKALLPDGREVGKVQLTERALSVAVTDEPALMAYVRRARPDEIVTTETLRPVYRTHLLADAKRQLTDPDGPGVVVDHDGEIIPGLELVAGSASYRPDPTPAGRVVVRQVLAELFGSSPDAPLALGGTS